MERIQIKWLAAAAILLPVALVAGIVEGLVTDGTGPVTLVSFLAAYLALTGAVAVAMLRHGLYDVDRVISRTIAWLGSFASNFEQISRTKSYRTSMPALISCPAT